MPPWRNRARRRLGWSAGIAAALALLAWLSLGIPLEIPRLPVPSRVYAHAHRVALDQDVDASGLMGRLRRLGYRSVDDPRPRPGEFHKTGRRLIVHRRGFDTPLARGPAGPVELRLDSRSRIASIRSGGSRMRHFLLEPESIGPLGNEAYVERTLVPLDSLPAHLVDVILTVEDRRFFEHGGLDLRRMAGAMLANLRALRLRQGGSTITQQLAKNLFLTHERTLLRKLREIWIALRLERTHSKREILEAYLNTIYLGQRGPFSVAGVEAGARHYFGKSARALTLAESALLAGMIRGPGFYSPFRDPQSARARRDQVLTILRDAGTLSEEQRAQATERPLGTLERPRESIAAPYFLAHLQRDLERELPELVHGERPFSIYTGLDPQLQLHAARAVRRGLEALEKGNPKLADASEPLQAALIALDPASGAILAHVGGRSWRESQFDRATQARRQTGSVFKPVVALAALSPGQDGAPRFTLASLLEDEPFSTETPEGPWTPVNHRKEFRGWVSLRVAIEDSINVPIARLGMALGPEQIVETARRMGIEAPLRPVPSIALGAFEMSPLEVAAAYAVFATGGRRTPARSFAAARDDAGRELQIPAAEPVQAFDPAAVALVTSTLRGAVERGTAHPLRGLGFRGPLAGKTGTSNDSRDAWFVGYTPDLVVAVWVGFDDGQGLGLTGSQAAIPIFADFMIASFGRDGGREFELPPGIERVRIHAETGLRAAFGCWGEPELFLEGTAPDESCGGWFRSARRGPRPEGHPAPRRRPPMGNPLGRIFDLIEDIVDEIARDLD